MASEAKWTPDPLEYHGEHGIITGEGGHRLVAENVQPDYGPLLAAAPLLYDRLKALVGYIEALDLDGNAYVAAECERAHAALALAEGK